MTWWCAVVEARHELQDPTGAETIRLLGERFGLRPCSRVLDVASGRGGPAILLAHEHGCRVEAAGLDGPIRIREADASSVSLEPGAYDAALCLGASFVFGGLAQTVAALKPAVRARGFVAVGDVYLRALEPDDEFAPLPEAVARFESAGVSLVTLTASTRDGRA